MKSSLMAFAVAANLFSQSLSAESHEEKKWTDNFTPIMTVFADFHSGFGLENDDRGFALGRCYLGFKYSLAGNLYARAIIDIGSFPKEEENQRAAYLKIAEVCWNYKRMTLNAGMISTTMFKLQESFWGKRYLMKSFQDEYGYGSSADLGLSIDYKFTDMLSADFIIANGEGYKKLQINDGLMYGLGITCRPVREFTMRIYGEINEGSEAGERASKDVAAFAGYKNGSFSLAAEYNRIFNFKHADGEDLYGCSVYGSWYACKWLEIFARYDNLMSNSDWNIDEDGQLGIAGVQFNLGKHIKISPNIHIWSPKDNSRKNQYYAYLNCSFNL